VKSTWFKNCKSQAEKDKVKQQILSQQEVIVRLEEILESMLKDTTTAAEYDSPSWAYLQADRNGYNRAVTTVLELINFNKD
jgi:hypothetical protein|tara:strand:+ start:277 stop:519 length:243 start_codon:yes stop_codon:yes gene_type:complete